jgi:tetratricopeptide (TPR) repeat protein
MEAEVVFFETVFDAETLNHQAWQLLMAPPDQRDPVIAFEMAQEAVRLAPAESKYLSTLEIAQYRNMEYAEAVATLERSLAEGKGDRDAFDLFFMSMCHANLGDTTKPKDSFERAIRWLEKHPEMLKQHAGELEAIRAEAESELKRLEP